MGAGEGGQAAREDHVPAGALHLPADLRRGARARRQFNRREPLDPLATDSLAPFRSAILAVRWGTLGVSVAFAYGDFQNHALRTTGWAAVLVALALWRTIRPIRAARTTELTLALILDLVVTMAAVIATDAWQSTFAFTLLPYPLAAGLARGWLAGFASCAVIVATVGLGDAIAVDTGLTEVSQWSTELLLVAVVAGYARRILGESLEERTRNLSRIGQLADANALLFSLHRVAQTLPASLDIDEALDSTMGRLADLFDYDAAAILLRDDTDGSWVVARRDRMRLPGRLDDEELPPPLQRAEAERVVVHERNLLANGGPGLAPSRSSGLYDVLIARGAVIGLISMEHAEANRFTERDIELLRGFVEPAALAIDNAQWFGRLRTVGAEEERNRIARDLHDRIGQSLAYLAFELDRIMKYEDRGDDVGPSLDQLREDIRSVITEVRDTLYDLRTDVSDTQGFLPTLELFITRIRERSPFRVIVRTDDRGRLPIPQERELFRIAQEALVNVERHAQAENVTVIWQCDGKTGQLMIADDGVGFGLGRSGRLDSYGIMGMRERAASIGAQLNVQSSPGGGTRIRCVVTAAGAPSPNG